MVVSAAAVGVAMVVVVTAARLEPNMSASFDAPALHEDLAALVNASEHVASSGDTTAFDAALIELQQNPLAPELGQPERTLVQVAQGRIDQWARGD